MYPDRCFPVNVKRVLSSIIVLIGHLFTGVKHFYSVTEFMIIYYLREDGEINVLPMSIGRCVLVVINGGHRVGRTQFIHILFSTKRDAISFFLSK